MTAAKLARQRGFTLTELLMVVAIVGALASVASVYMSPAPKPIDVANRVGDLMREGSRRAVALGPVRSAVARALNSRARTRIIAQGSSPQPTFILQRLAEDPMPAITASWVEIARYTIDKSVIAESYASAIGPRSTLALSTSWAGFVAHCFPDGKCEARTVYFDAVRPGSSRYARLAVMPLGGAILTRRDWD